MSRTMRASLAWLCGASALGASAALAQTAPAPAAPPEAIQGVSTFIARQEPGQWLGENLEEKEVYTPDGQGIGEIDDVLIDQSGRVIAVVIEVGGFLGIREKRIAVPLSALEFQRPDATTDNPDNTRVILRLGKAELESAPAFRSLDSRR
jgi:hypothetical protein